MNSLNIRKGDTVVVLTGKDRGKKGEVLTVMPQEGKVIVKDINVATKHKKPRKQTDQGGIVQMETPIYVSKVQRVCPKCGMGTRHASKVLENGKKVRVCKKCGAEI